MPWNRDTEWHQGAILDSQHFPGLGIGNALDGSIAMAVSHSCDITNDNLDAEPFVEFVLGEVISEENGNFAYAKNPRTLHLPATYRGSAVFVELSATRKTSICKDRLHEIPPSFEWSLAESAFRTLQYWLSSRYKRQALPDALVERLRPVSDFLQKIGKKHSRAVLGYWLDYDPHVEELPADQPYEIWIYVVYSIDEATAASDADQVATELRNRFHALIAKNGGAGSVTLKECGSYSEEEFTLRDLRVNTEYRLEFISLRPKSAGPISN